MKRLVMFNEQIKKNDAIADAQSILLNKGLNVVGHKEVEMDMNLISMAKTHGLLIEQSGRKFYLISQDLVGKKIEKEIVCVQFLIR